MWKENWEPVNIFLLGQVWRQEWKLKVEIHEHQSWGSQSLCYMSVVKPGWNSAGSYLKGNERCLGRNNPNSQARARPDPGDKQNLLSPGSIYEANTLLLFISIQRLWCLLNPIKPFSGSAATRQWHLHPLVKTPRCWQSTAAELLLSSFREGTESEWHRWLMSLLKLKVWHWKDKLAVKMTPAIYVSRASERGPSI